MEEDSKLPDAATLLSLISAYVVCVSVSYNFGYYFPIDTKLLYLFSISDIIISSIPYVPWVVGCLFLGIAARRYDIPVPPLIERSGGAVIGRFGPSPCIAIYVEIAIIVLIGLFSYFWAFAVFMFVAVNAGKLQIWLLEKGYIGNNSISREIFSLLSVAVMALFFGFSQGQSALLSGTPTHVLYYPTGDMKVKILGVSSNYLIAIAANRRVVALSTDGLISMSEIEARDLTPPLSFHAILRWIRSLHSPLERSSDRRDE